MKRTVIRAVPAVALLVAGLAWVSPRLSGQASPELNTKNGDWPMYTADIRGSKYSPASQITAANFSKLQVAWRFKTDNLGPRPETKLGATPIMVKDTVYAAAGTRRAVVALDARTGELKWKYSMDEGERATRWAPRQLSGRGVSYWTDGKGDDRIIYVTTGYRLVSLNAKTGQPVASFGQNGVIDLKVGVVIGKDKQIDLEKGEIGLHAVPLIVGDKIIVGSAMFEGLGYTYATNAKGLIRAYDARTGKQLWRFNTIPYPGEKGNETWENGSWEWTGNVGVWTHMTADTEAGIVYLPVETPTIDEYGGNRPGDNLYAESLVAVDLNTGKYKWHFQFVHHPIWDHDMSSPGLIIDRMVNGRMRKLIAVPSKQGWLYIFDRITGEPLFPIEERPVPQSTMKGEKTAKTQPFPTVVEPYSRTHIAESDLIDFTPELRAQALLNLKKFRWEQIPYVPPTGPESPNLLGAINIGNTNGGVNWPGSAFDLETGHFYSAVYNSAVTVGHYDEEEFDKVRPDNPKNKIPRWEAEPNYGMRVERPAGGAAAPTIQFPGATGRQALGEGLGGLSIVKPPYGMVVSMDVATGKLRWSTPHGDTPDTVRNHPALKDKTIPKTGQGGVIGVAVTKTLLIAGDPQVTNMPGRGRAAMLRAYSKETGEQVGEVPMPAPQSGSPMTYTVDGKQYIIVAVSGGGYNAEYIAYALPPEAITATAAGRQ